MKNSKKLSKLVALSVLMSGMLYSSAWAAYGPNEIEIGESTTSKGDSVATGVNVGTNGVGVTSGAMGSTVSKIFTDGSVDATVYGIKVTGSDSVTADSITNGIVVKTDGVGSEAYGIYFGNSDTSYKNSIAGLKGIETYSSYGSAYGIYASNGINTVTFATGGTIKSWTNNESAMYFFGIKLEGGNNTIGDGTLQGISVDSVATCDSPNCAISVTDGTNAIKFSGADSYISVKNTGDTKVCGISFDGVGTTSVSNLGSITAETAGNYDSSDAYGIYAKNTNTDNTKKFSVTFVDAGGSIVAYSAGDKNYGIAFDAGSTGTSEVKNVKTITVGVATTGGSISSGAAYGIYAVAGVNKVTFTGAGSSITAKSSGEAYGTYEAYGIYVDGSGDENNPKITVHNLGAINVTSKTNVQGIYVKGGSIQDSEINFTGDGSIIAESAANDNSGYAMGINLNAIADIKVNNVGDIKVTSKNDAYGCYVSPSDATGINTISFNPNSYIVTKGDLKNYGLYLTSGTNTIGTTEHELTGIKAGFDNAGITSGWNDGIYVFGGTNKVAFSGATSSIEAKSNGSDVYGIAFAFINHGLLAFAAIGTTEVTGLGKITAETTSTDATFKNAYGICTANGNDPDGSDKFSVSFDDAGGSITAYSENGENYGIKFASLKFEESPGSGTYVEKATGKSEVKNVKTITVGVKSGISPEEISSGAAYGIQAMAGTNTISFVEGSSITAKSTGGNAYGIAFGTPDAAATGTTTITGLGSITAETTSESEQVNEKVAYGIYACNGNTDDKKFSVSFDSTNGGSINAYSAKGENYGILFKSGSTGTSEVKNVKTITVGVNGGSVSDGTAFGICSYGGTNSVVFKENGSITAKSNYAACGIILNGSTLTVSNLGGTMDGIIVPGGNENNFTKICIETDGTLNLKNSTIKATDNVRTIYAPLNGSMNFNLSDTTKVYGPVYVKNTGGTLNVDVDSTSELHVDSYSGSGTMKVTNSGKFFVEGKLALPTTESNITSNSGSEIYFIVPSDFDKGTDTMLKLKDDITIGSGVGIYVNTSALTGLEVGDVITLMDVGSANDITLGSTTFKVWNGSSYVDTSNITLNGTSKLIYTVEEFTPPTPPTGKIIEIQTDGKSQIGGTASTYYSGTDYVGADGKVNLDAAIDQIKTVDAGVASNVYGIKVDGTKSITVTSLKDGISVKSTSGNAYGISLAGTGTNTISGLGSVTANSTGSSMAYGIYTTGGVNTISFKGDGAQAITARGSEDYLSHSIYTTGGTTTVNFEDSILSGKIHQQDTATLTLNFNNGGVWTPVDGDVTGTVTVKVNDGGKVRFDKAATVNSTITNSTGTVEVNAKDVSVTSIKGSNGVETYAFDLTGLTTDETMLNITSTTDSLDLGTDDVLSVTTGDFVENGVITLIKETTGTFNLTGLKFEVDGTVIDDTEVGEFFKLANNDKSITFTNVVTDVTIKPEEQASDNIVTVTGDRTATVNGVVPAKTPKQGRHWKDVYGGYAKTGDSNNNEVNIENGLIKGNVYGGYAETGDVTGNTINITGGEIAGNVYAGVSDETGATVTGNTINWSAGTIKGSEITANTINITGTDATYLGTTGVMATDEAVNLAGTLTVGNGTEASVLTIDTGLMAGTNAILQVQKDSQVITKGTSIVSGAVNGSGKLVNQGEMTIYSDKAVVESTVDNTAGTLEIAGTTWTGAVAVGGTVNLKLEDYSNITNYDAKGGNINIASGLITFADVANTVSAGTKLNLTETATYKTLSENVFDAAGNLKGNVAFVAGTLELTDATYSVSSLKSVQGKLGENTQLKMDGKPDSGEVITTKIMSDLGQKVVLPTVTVKAEEKNTLIGTNTGATVEVVGVGVMNDKQAEGFNVDKLDLKAGSTGLVITNDKKVALGGNADTTGKGNLVTVDGKAEQVNIVVGLPKTIEGTTETKGTLAIGIKGSTNENGYVLKGNITANKDSEVEVNADTEITGKVELKEEAKFVAADNVKVVMSDLDLDDSSMTVGEGSVVETATLTAGSTQEKGLESSITGKVDVKDTFVIDKSSKEGETAKTVTILVGNEEGKGVVLAKKIELGGNIIFVDPAWVPGVGVEGASQVATETTALDGTYIAGQNAILSFGTTDEQKAVMDFAATGLNWSESDVTAMAYILKPIDVSNGALIVDGSMTKKPAEVSANGTVTFADQSLLMVDGIICHDTAAISGIKILTVADTSKLYIANGVAGGQYKILAGNVENGWSNKANILSNATVKVEDILIDKESGVYTITLGKSDYKFADTKIPNVATAMNEATVDTAAKKYMQTALDYGTLVSHQGMVDSINALGNMGAIAGVNHSQFTIANLAEDSVNRHLDIQNNKVGKEIWAEVIHTKENVNGLGGNEVDYKGQYNGTIVGADLVKNDKFTFGAALSHVKGDNNGNFSSKNETKHTGVTLYGRSMLPNDAAITYDIAFMHGTNDMRMTTPAVADTRITGDQTVNSFSVGTRFEQKVQVGKNTSIQPYVGARWLRMKNGSFTNSLGMNYDSASSNTVIVPLGLSFKAGVENGGWKMALTGDVGYQWNLGNKDITTNLSYNNGCNAVDATFADANDWYAGVGLEFAKKNFTASVGTRYMKGSSTKQNRWFANLAWSF